MKFKDLKEGDFYQLDNSREIFIKINECKNLNTLSLQNFTLNKHNDDFNVIILCLI